MKFRLVLLLLLPVLSSALAEGAVVVGGDFATGSPVPTITITTPVTLAVTNDTVAVFLVFQGWVAAADGSETEVAAAGGTKLSYRIDDGPVMTVDVLSAGDNVVVPGGDLSVLDGYLRLGGDFEVLAGDTLTILPGSYVFAADPAFNAAAGTFTGAAYLADLNGLRISETAATVPEPSTALALGIGSMGMLMLLRRKNGR